jgi:O-acetyl-ADP-ribose deacetylase (regulator of RNase III)
MLYERRGNLLDSSAPVIAHGCNCFNVMGAGVALAIRNKYPEVYKADLETVRGDRNKLGTFTKAQVEAEPIKIIYNLYTQYSMGGDKVHLDYQALETSFEAMIIDLKKNKALRSPIVAIPRIGCGLAGGNWDVVKEIIQNLAVKYTIPVFVWSY